MGRDFKSHYKMKYKRIFLLLFAIFGLNLSSAAGSNEKKEMLSEPTMIMNTDSIDLASIYLTGTGTAVIDWGDERRQVVNLPSSAYQNYRYTNSAPRTITITGANITTLYCTSNVLRSPGNRIISLDVSNNPALTHLVCSDNLLTSLDVSKNMALIRLECVNNRLTSLDLSKNTALTELWCYNNQLAFLDISNSTALENLRCNNNQLTSLNVSKNTTLEVLHCDNNQLAFLDASNNTALRELICSNNQLMSLNVGKSTVLEALRCNNNQLTFLDVSNNTALKELICSNNQLISLDVGKNTVLEILHCSENQLTSLAINKSAALKSADFSDNPLTSLHIIKNIELKELIKSDKADPIERAQCEQISYEIDAMQLICDTINYRPPYYGEEGYYYDFVLFSGFTGIYFDEKGRLRKYFLENISRDGSSECMKMSAYYDENGVLVFLSIESSYHCGNGSRSYYISQGRMIYFEGSEWCDCCEEEVEEGVWVAGEESPVFINWELLANFIYAETLLKTLQSEDRSYNAWR